MVFWRSLSRFGMFSIRSPFSHSCVAVTELLTGLLPRSRCDAGAVCCGVRVDVKICDFEEHYGSMRMCDSVDDCLVPVRRMCSFGPAHAHTTVITAISVTTLQASCRTRRRGGIGAAHAAAARRLHQAEAPRRARLEPGGGSASPPRARAAKAGAPASARRHVVPSSSK